MTADPKPVGRVRDPELLRRLHLEWRSCALCGNTGRLSLHHVHKRPRDDIRANLVMLCGDGVQGCHGRIENHDHRTCRILGRYLVNDRHDTIEYLADRLGGVVAVREWLSRSLHYEVSVR